jgi:hypothetical protein
MNFRAIAADIYKRLYSHLGKSDEEVLQKVMNKAILSLQFFFLHVAFLSGTQTKEMVRLPLPVLIFLVFHIRFINATTFLPL